MKRDDLTYVLILVGSVIISALLRLVPARARATTSAAIGVLSVVGACKELAALPATALLLALANHVVVPARWRRASAMGLAFCHLGAVRSFGYADGPTNAVLLVLVLRLSAAGDPEHGPRGMAELTRYACCYHGLFTAPFFTYADWTSAMRAPQPLPTASAVGRAVVAVLGAVGIWQCVATMLPFDHALDAGPAWAPWASLPAGSRYIYFYFSSYQFRWRFYACWLVMHVSGMLIGFSKPSNGGHSRLLSSRDRRASRAPFAHPPSCSCLCVA